MGVLGLDGSHRGRLELPEHGHRDGDGLRHRLLLCVVHPPTTAP
jgi:hypothetical protein